MAYHHAYAHLLRAYPQLAMTYPNLGNPHTHAHGDLQPPSFFHIAFDDGGWGSPALIQAPPSPPLQPREVDAVLDDYTELWPEQRGTIHLLVKNAAGVERAVVLFQIISLAQVMRSGNRTEGTVNAMIARIEGKVDATLNLITSVEGKVGAAIDRVAAIESKLDAMVQTVQDQRHYTAQDETVHRDGQFKLAKLKDSLLVVAKDFLAQPQSTDYGDFVVQLASYAQTHAAWLNIESLFADPALTAQVLSGCYEVASTAKRIVLRSIRSSITPGPTMKPLREFALEFASNFLKNGAPFPLSDDYIYHCARLRNFAQANFGLLCADAPAMPSPDITVKTEDAPPCSMDSPSTSGTRVGERADTAADPTAASTSSELDLDATFWKHYGQDIRQLSASCPSQEAYVTRMEALVREDLARYGAAPARLRQGCR